MQEHAKGVVKCIAGGFLAFTALCSSIAIAADNSTDIRVGAAAINLKADDDMPLAGSLEARYTKEQEGELRAIAVVVEKPGRGKVAIVACDVLWVPRNLADSAVEGITITTGIPASNILINATHTHSAPSTAPAHAFGVSEKFGQEVRGAIVKSVQEANKNLAGGDARFFFQLGEEKTVGANSRMLLEDGNITWINPQRESAGKGKPTGPFDPQLPVLDFRDTDGKTRALIYNHSTHTIGTRVGRDVRSPGFYGLTAQEMEKELGGVVSFLEGASGSTHNVTQVPVAECIERLKQAIRDARAKAQPRPVAKVAGIRRAFKFHVRKFNDSEEDAKIVNYTTKYTPQASDRIREIFSIMRKQLEPQQGEERETWVQAIVIGDVAIVGVPAEYFTLLGVDIKKRSPFKETYVAELANDWVGYMPDREGHKLGGYQTWMGLHSYAEEGTGERVADMAIEILNELAGKAPAKPSGDGSAKLDSPRNPQQEHETFRLADPNLTMELVASEPNVVSPVAAAWDADGQMYVAEYSGYPDTPGLGRIRKLIDADSDGRIERSQVFAEGLNFPASIMPFRDGLLIADSPDILFLKDADGDGRADERRVEWTGFIPGSQQLRANSLHWGIDNWIYGANGRCDGEIQRAGRKDPPAVSIRGRDFRFQPDHSAFEAIAGQSQFGQVHDDWGNRFLSWNTIPIRHAVIPDRFLERNTQLMSQAVLDIAQPQDDGRVFGISRPPRQFNAERADFYNALCGLTLLRGDGLGADYVGNAFVGESLTNLITRRVLHRNGVSFVSERKEKDREFLAATDNWFHPVNMASGPDGCLYVLDFYRELVEHPLYVGSQELRQRVDWRHGSEHGRIWRIRHKDFVVARDRRQIALNAAPVEKLVETLSHPVAWWRDTAQRILVSNQRKEAVPLLRALVRHKSQPVAKLHALWTLDGLESLDDEDLLLALADHEANVRRHAITLAEPRLAKSGELRDAVLKLVADDDDTVRLVLAYTLGTITPQPEAAIIELMERSRNNGRILLAGLTSTGESANRITRELVQRDASWFESPSPPQLELLQAVGHAIGNRRDKDVMDFIESLSLGEGENSASARKLSLGALVLLGGLAEGFADSKRDPAEHLYQSERGGRFPIVISRYQNHAAEVVLDESRPAVARRSALHLLPFGSKEKSLEVIRTVLKTSSDVPFQTAAASMIRRWTKPETLQLVFADWQQYSQQARRAILVETAGSAAATAVLLSEMEAKRILPVELPLDVDAALRGSKQPEIKARAEKVLGAAQSGDRAAVIDKLKDALALSGESSRGAQLFKQNCVTCHTVQGFGRKVGPDLSGIGARPAESLIVDVLDPSRQVSPDYVSFLVLMTDGRVQTGLLTAETAAAVTLRRAEGEDLVIPRSEIEALRATGKSLMPDGIEQKIDRQGLADLLAFLRAPDRTLLGSR